MSAMGMSTAVISVVLVLDAVRTVKPLRTVHFLDLGEKRSDEGVC